MNTGIITHLMSMVLRCADKTGSHLQVILSHLIMSASIFFINKHSSELPNPVTYKWEWNGKIITQWALNSPAFCRLLKMKIRYLNKLGTKDGKLTRNATFWISLMRRFLDWLIRKKIMSNWISTRWSIFENHTLFLWCSKI